MVFKSEWIGNSEIPYSKVTEEPERVEGDEIYIGDLDPSYDFDTKATLTDIIADGFTLFSHGIFQSAGLSFDPVQSFMAEWKISREDGPQVIELGYPLLHGIPRPFDRVLFACPNNLTTKLAAYLGRFTLAVGGQLYSATCQHIVTLDVIEARRTLKTKIPLTVPVYLYGLASDKETLTWKQPIDPLTQVPKLIQRDLPKKKERTT